MRARLAEEAAVFLLALQFLTRLPVARLPAFAAAFTPARMAASPRWHPGVGLLIGAAAGLAYWVAAAAWPPALAALAAIAAGLALTGALHEDGLADLCDGLGGGSGGGAGRERTLEIMRDSRIGAHGAIGLGMALAARATALAALPVAAAPLVLVAGHGASRASMVLALATGRYARARGAGVAVAAGPGAGGLAFALALGALALLALGLVLPAAAVAGGLAGLAAGHVALRAAYERRLGGWTGDCLGAVQQASELGLLLGVLACL